MTLMVDGKNQEIQALRAVAILLVLFHHYKMLLPELPPDWYRYVEGMWSGVDLFFCISGYVISKSLIFKLKEKRGDEFWREVLSFWIKRAYRILPSAWLWLVITLAMVAIYNTHNRQFTVINIGDVLSAVFQVSNFHFWQCENNPEHHCGIMSIYWSLSLEEQFYLIFPVLIYLFRNRIGFLLLVVFFAQVFLPRTHWSGISSFIRTDAVILGVLLAIISNESIYQVFNPKNIPVLINKLTAPILIAGIAMIPTMKVVSFHMGLTAFVCFVALWLASYNNEYFLKEGLLRKMLVKIGERSFSIYLIHLVSFSIVKAAFTKIFADSALSLMYISMLSILTGLTLTGILVELNYRLIEIPFMMRGRNISEKIISL